MWAVGRGQHEGGSGKVLTKMTMTIREASFRYSVPRGSDRIKLLSDGKEITPQRLCNSNKGTYKCTFNEYQEETLYNHVKALDNQLMQLNNCEFLKLVY
ncbi:hypothetical protein QE152_g35816 [Popillia japonica]|uniref:Uncharacterized protein n=1 Tax=Popillia japonica TaxID=7064 RepID=A0AAW1IF02_POPJA